MNDIVDGNVDVGRGNKSWGAYFVDELDQKPSVARAVEELEDVTFGHQQFGFSLGDEQVFGDDDNVTPQQPQHRVVQLRSQDLPSERRRHGAVVLAVWWGGE